MPLTGAAHNRGRSDLKICELAMAGHCPSRPTCRNYATWKDTVGHRDEVRERAMALREIVLRDRTMPEAIEPWRVAMTAALQMARRA